jgi:hypothetical protein
MRDEMIVTPRRSSSISSSSPLAYCFGLGYRSRISPASILMYLCRRWQDGPTREEGEREKMREEEESADGSAESVEGERPGMQKIHLRTQLAEEKGRQTVQA